MGEKSTAVLDCAKQLALDGRDDEQAVAELRAAAKGNHRALQRALKASRFGGHHRELRYANLVYRLLDAACGGGPLAAVSAEDRERIEAVEAMRARPEEERWGELVALEPRLLELEAEVKAGAFGDVSPLEPESGVETGPEMILPDGRRVRPQIMHMSSSDPPRPPEEAREVLDKARGLMAVQMRLSKLVGPDSGQRSVLLRCVAAQGVAVRHLMKESG